MNTSVNGIPFHQSKEKRAPTKMLHPMCAVCGKPVDGWMFHQSGHIDGTPIFILRCHGVMRTWGCTPDQAEQWREQFRQRFLSGNEQITWKQDGSLEPADSTPAQQPPPAQSSGGSV